MSPQVKFYQNYKKLLSLGTNYREEFTILLVFVLRILLPVLFVFVYSLELPTTNTSSSPKRKPV